MAIHGSGDHLYNTVKADQAFKKGLHRHLIGGVEHRGHGPPGLQGLVGHPQGGELLMVGKGKGQVVEFDQIQGRDACLQPLGIGEGIGDGDPHIGDTELGDQGAVHIFHQGVNHPLGMDQDLDPLRGDLEEPVGLDDLQSLIHHGGGIHGDLGPHLPYGMGQGLLRGYLF